MKQIPILFSTPMVQAILDGRKTVTRRIIKFDELTQNEHGNWCYSYKNHAASNQTKESMNDDFFGLRDYSPYGKVGDVLWVRETFWHGHFEPDEVDERCPDCDHWEYLYCADTRDARPCDVSDEWCINEYGHDKRDWPAWKPSIHMPKDAARIWLEVTGVEVQRAHDISYDDITAEGVRYPVSGPPDDNGMVRPLFKLGIENSALSFMPNDWKDAPPEQLHKALLNAHWAELWCEINGRESWEANPWVWVVRFKVLSTTGKPSHLI
jgi:hypothetical protein